LCANPLRRLYAAITYASSGTEPLAELTASFYSAHEGIGENKSFRRRPKAKN
jgi:hypothetical protein